MRPESALCLCRHDVGHFGNAVGRGVFTDAGHSGVFTGCSLSSSISVSVWTGATLSVQKTFAEEVKKA
ncbi:hypothetical protein ACQKMI_18025 [Lysinibacillus sp. NPDC097214]|uniref:hypothetical protein n=1 Tax=Lysinibacillus sp. NPDC097214 TaxID=3390584 RepID=UPI003CFC4FF8